MRGAKKSKIRLRVWLNDTRDKVKRSCGNLIWKEERGGAGRNSEEISQPRRRDAKGVSKMEV